MKHIFRSVLLLLAALAPHAEAAGQSEKLQAPDVEYGDLSELRGNRVFVNSENLATRERILRELVKLPLLRVVGRAQDADVILLFGGALASSGSEWGNYLDAANGINNDRIDAVAFAVVNEPAPHARVLWVSTARRASISTAQALELYPFHDGLRARIIKLLISGFFVSRWPAVPLGRAPEAKAARAFVSALRQARGGAR
jgi:hypothetical protein